MANQSGGSDERQRVASEMRNALQRHVIDAWFPRCVDLERGGFISDFDGRWQRGPSKSRMLEFQARQTRVVARLAIAFPEDGRWSEYALHGLRFLQEQMWDPTFGGWYWIVGADGEPLAGGTKHAHSSAYSTQAAALVFEATGERAALEHAEEGLAWFAGHAHDQEFGGFHSWLTREGEVIRDRSGVPAGATPIDPMGHDIGLKDANVLGDWVEALLDFTANSDSPQAAALLHEFMNIYLKRAITPGGDIHYAFYPDWTPQPGPEWYGYGFEATQRLLFAAHWLPQFPELTSTARQVLIRTVRGATSRRGGFNYAGPGGAARTLEGGDLLVHSKVWWVQFEALRGLALYAAEEPQPGPFTRRLTRHWEYITTNFLDEQFGGIHYSPLPARSRLLRRSGKWRRKASDWKDASHETACLLEAAAVLAGEPRRRRGTRAGQPA